MLWNIDYKTSANAQRKIGMAALKKEIEDIERLAAIVAEVPYDVLSYDTINGILWQLNYRIEDYETEIKRRKYERRQSDEKH
jgi:hypothetical protein